MSCLSEKKSTLGERENIITKISLTISGSNAAECGMKT